MPKTNTPSKGSSSEWPPALTSVILARPLKVSLSTLAMKSFLSVEVTIHEQPCAVAPATHKATRAQSLQPRTRFGPGARSGGAAGQLQRTLPAEQVSTGPRHALARNGKAQSGALCRGPCVAARRATALRCRRRRSGGLQAKTQAAQATEHLTSARGKGVFSKAAGCARALSAAGDVATTTPSFTASVAPGLETVRTTPSLPPRRSVSSQPAAALSLTVLPRRSVVATPFFCRAFFSHRVADNRPAGSHGHGGHRPARAAAHRAGWEAPRHTADRRARRRTKRDQAESKSCAEAIRMKVPRADTRRIERGAA